ncbi:MAG TPA: hypothetical protein PKH24_05445 [Sedimentisphaerales bacterium]|jgi:hypothetical protein|nr:hypothetical protein [Sedimentisphaerales bacterium]HNU29006.1 hypothetical protein [Sedimentisphaerales bacterium]
MSVTLDGQAVFDEQGLTITVGSPSRACMERAVAGLDGTLSIDLGARARQVRQTGTLHAPSRPAMHARVQTIAAFIDGQTHTLTTPDGQVLDNLRMDSFKKVAEYPGGPGVVADYEVVYTQLGG